jgi:hypothetical protein
MWVLTNVCKTCKRVASTATSYNTLSSGSTIRCPTLPGNHCTTSLVTRHSWSFKSLGRSHRLLKGEQCKRAITPGAITPGAITPGAITSHRLGPSLYKPRSGSFSTLYRRELVFPKPLKTYISLYRQDMKLIHIYIGNGMLEIELRGSLELLCSQVPNVSSNFYRQLNTTSSNLYTTERRPLCF